MLVDIFADQVHAHRSPDGGDIPGAQHGDDILQGVQHDLLVDDDLGVVGVEVVRHLLGVFQVDGVLAHADGKGADGFAQFFGRNGADQAGIQPAGKQKAHGGIGVQPFVHTGHQLFPDVGKNFRQFVLGIGRGIGNIAVAHKLAVAVVAADGERIDLFAQPHQVFGLRRKGDAAGFAVAVEQRPDADGVPRRDEQLFAAVVENHGELGVQMFEHLQAVFIIQRQDDLAVGIRLEGVALGLQFLFDGAETVQLTVAHHTVGPAEEGLHALRRKAHDGQPPEAQQAELRFADALVVRPAGGGAQQVRGESFFGQVMSGIAHDTAHFDDTPYVLTTGFPPNGQQKKTARSPFV